MFEFFARLFRGWNPAPAVVPAEPIAPEVAPIMQPIDISDFAGLYAEATLSQGAGAAIQAAAIVAHRSVYSAVGTPLGIPWWWVGCIHFMESSGDFTTHLHNGNPLSARTTDAPAGRPIAGRPPFTWAESAADALSMRNLQGVAWTVAEALRQAEAYNGMGYASRGIRTPYVWAATSLEQAGRYVADDVWDSTAMSKQIGVAAMMLAMQAGGLNLTA